MPSKDEFVIHEHDISNTYSSNDATTSFAINIRLQLFAHLLRSLFECILFYSSLLSSFMLILTYYYHASMKNDFITNVYFIEPSRNVSLNRIEEAKLVQSNNQLWLLISLSIFIVSYFVRVFFCLNVHNSRIYTDVHNANICRVILSITSAIFNIDFLIWYINIYLVKFKFK